MAGRYSGGSGLTDGTLEAELDGLEERLTTVEEDGGGGGGGPETAAELPFVPAGTIAADDVQAAIEEVAADAASALTAGLATKADDGATTTALGTKIAAPGSPAEGDLLLYTGGTWSRLPKGTDEQILVVTGGVPAWVDPAPATPRIIGARGFSDGNSLKTANGTCPGAAAFTIGGLVYTGQVQVPAGGSVKGVVSGGTQFNAGYFLGYDGNRPFCSFYDGAQTISTGGTHPSWGWVDDAGPNGWQLANLKALMMVMVRTSTTLTLWLNGQLWRHLTAVPGYTPSASGLFLGSRVNAAEWNEDSLIAGAAYVEAALSEAEVLEWTRDCMKAADVVDGGPGFDSLWSFRQSGLEAGDAVPATIEDQIGSADLTLTGALVVDEDLSVWL